MHNPELDVVVGGVITRADTVENGGLSLSVAVEGRTVVVSAVACQCGRPCDLTHTTVTTITGVELKDLNE